MRAPVVVKAYPVSDHAAGVLYGLEAMSMRALFVERADHAFNHAILLRAVRCDELLTQPVASHQRGVAARREDQPVVGSQQERHRHAAQRPEAGNQGMLQRAAGGASLAASRQVPGKQLACMAVNHQRQRCPAIPTRPNAAKVR